ncbi:hypothetical protein ACFLK3_05400 [Rickettsia sibirica]
MTTGSSFFNFFLDTAIKSRYDKMTGFPLPQK